MTLVPLILIGGVIVSVLVTWTVAARLIARMVLRGPSATALRAD